MYIDNDANKNVEQPPESCDNKTSPKTENVPEGSKQNLLAPLPSNHLKHSKSNTAASKSRIAAYQSFLYCTATFFVAVWVFLPWVSERVEANRNTLYFFSVMTNLINPSQGIFNLFIYVRLEYIRLRTKEKFSRYESFKICLFSPKTN